MYNYNKIFDSKQKARRYCKGSYRYSDYDTTWWVTNGRSSQECTYCNWCINNKIIDISNCSIENITNYGTNCDSYKNETLTTLNKNGVKIKLSMIDGETNDIPLFLDKTKSTKNNIGYYILPSSCEYYLNIDYYKSYRIKCYIGDEQVLIKDNTDTLYNGNLKIGNFNNEYNNEIFFFYKPSIDEQYSEILKKKIKSDEIRLFVIIDKDYNDNKPKNHDLSNNILTDTSNNILTDSSNITSDIIYNEIKDFEIDDPMDIDEEENDINIEISNIDKQLYDVIEFKIYLLNNQDDNTLFMDNMQYNEKKIDYLQGCYDTIEIIKDEYESKINNLNDELNDIQLNITRSKILYDEYVISTLDKSDDSCNIDSSLNNISLSTNTDISNLVY